MIGQRQIHQTGVTKNQIGALSRQSEVLNNQLRVLHYLFAGGLWQLTLRTVVLIEIGVGQNDVPELPLDFARFHIHSLSHFHNLEHLLKVDVGIAFEHFDEPQGELYVLVPNLLLPALNRIRVGFTSLGVHVKLLSQSFEDHASDLVSGFYVRLNVSQPDTGWSSLGCLLLLLWLCLCLLCLLGSAIPGQDAEHGPVDKIKEMGTDDFGVQHGLQNHIKMDKRYIFVYFQVIDGVLLFLPFDFLPLTCGELLLKLRNNLDLRQRGRQQDLGQVTIYPLNQIFELRMLVVLRGLLAQSVHFDYKSHALKQQDVLSQ